LEGRYQDTFSLRLKDLLGPATRVKKKKKYQDGDDPGHGPRVASVPHLLHPPAVHGSGLYIIIYNNK